ncbi:hypothetical protein [Streptosporangium sp. NPDC002721]|uniref:hypothetical protein n=1 Tax=Streptosporangium sp. NPDC002721 TaxID=3366188 RepID=UPI0036780306
MALRVVTMLGYRPAWLFYGDSYAYLDAAERLRPLWGFQPSGYPMLLWALRPFHSLAVVTAFQHLLGLGVGVMIYALLRRMSLPAWGATLATVPVLLNASFLALEHSVLSDTMFVFLVVSAVTALMWSPRPSAWQVASAGLLLTAAALTRTIAVPLIVLVAAYLLARRVGWRRLCVLTVVTALPLALYAGWYGRHHGRFGLVGGDGVALWARTMTFADCEVVRPPRRLAPLCPNGSRQDAASEYVWAADSAINRMPGGFGNNDLAREFAVRAIAAQPFDYVRSVVGDTLLAFAWTPVPHPKRVRPAFGFVEGNWPLRDDPAVRRIVHTYDPAVNGVRSVAPYAGFLSAYQYPAYVRGPMLAALLLLGALGVWRGAPSPGTPGVPGVPGARRATLSPGARGTRRRALLPLGTAVFLLVAPVAVLDFDHRYVLPVIPLACLAAALGVAGARGPRQGVDSTGRGRWKWSERVMSRLVRAHRGIRAEPLD